MKVSLVLIFTFNLILNSYTLPVHLLYEYNSATQLPNEDDVSVKVILTVPIIFYGERYKTIFVSVKINFQFILCL